MKTKNKFEIKKCPDCSSTALLIFEGDLFCKSCNWDSIAMSVARGDYDSIFNWATDDIQKQEEVTKSIVTQVEQPISA